MHFLHYSIWVIYPCEGPTTNLCEAPVLSYKVLYDSYLIEADIYLEDGGQTLPDNPPPGRDPRHHDEVGDASIIPAKRTAI